MNITFDTDYLVGLSSLLTKVKWSSLLNENKVAVAGGAVRDMLFNKPISDIDVFYEGKLDNKILKQYFKEIEESDSVYPDGFNVTHKTTSSLFPVPIQLIQVKDIKEHISSFPSPMCRVWVDNHGVHGIDFNLIDDALSQSFYWDKPVDAPYFNKIKNKYNDWKHQFTDEEFNPETLVSVDLE